MFCSLKLQSQYKVRIVCCSMLHILRCYCHAGDRHIILQKARVVGQLFFRCWSRSFFLCLRTMWYCWLVSGHIESPQQYASVNTRIILQSGSAQVLRPSEGLGNVCPHSGFRQGLAAWRKEGCLPALLSPSVSVSLSRFCFAEHSCICLTK